MSTTITLSMETLLLGVPSLVAFSGAVTFVALRGYLTDAVEGHRLLAAADERSARWLFLRGYRRTPHAGPDVTPEPEPLAIAATAFDPDADEVGDEQPGATLMRPVLAVARWVGYALALVDTVVEWVRQWAIGVKHDLRERFKSNAQREAEDRVEAEFWNRVNQPALTAEPVEAEADEDRWAEDSAITDAPDTAEPVNAKPYEGRHWLKGIEHTGAWPVINRVPAQRTGDADV